VALALADSVGLYDRDYMRTPNAQPKRARRVAVALLVGASALVIVSADVRSWIRDRIGRQEARGFAMKPLWGLPSVRVGPKPSLYPPNDRWRTFLAPESVCPGGRSEQAQAICMLNFSRERAGLPALQESTLLSRSAELKARDIARCEEFSHGACGKEPRAGADAVGYSGRGWGENIYAGPGPYAPARLAVDGWLNSEHHRENLFSREWREQGVGVVHLRSFLGQRDVAIWVSQLGG
jgi:hypothetical protein